MSERAHVIVYGHDREASWVTWHCPCEKSSWQNPCGCVFPDPRGVGVLARDDQRKRRAEQKGKP